MKYVLCLLAFFYCSCSVYRDTTRSVDTDRTSNVELDALDARYENSILEKQRLLQGGYIIRGSWKIFDTKAPQLPDGSFPVLAEGNTEERGSVEESAQKNEETHSRDSSALSVNSSDEESVREYTSDKVDSETKTGWFRMLLFGIVLGVIGLLVIWMKYGKKN